MSLVTPGYVAKYDRQGATQFVIEGLRHPLGLALSGPFNELFVASGDGVGKFNAKTGAAIKRDFITAIALSSFANLLFADSGHSLPE